MQSSALTKVPSLLHRLLAIVVSAVTAAGFGTLAYWLWQPSPPNKYSGQLEVIAWICAGLSMLSLTLLYRALFTRSRSPDKQSIRLASFALVGLGIVGLIVAIFPQAPATRLLILAGASGCLSHGLGFLGTKQ